MFDYPLLQALLAIEREGSFENAAKAMAMSKSAISQKITLLERRLEAPVLERNPARPTALGKSLCRHFERVLLKEAAFFAEHRNLFDTNRTEIVVFRIAVNDDMPSRCLLDALELFPSDHPSFCFDVVIQRDGDAIDSLRNEDAAASISTTKTSLSGFEMYQLGTMTFVAAASPDFVAHVFPDGFLPDAIAQARSASFDAENDLNFRFVSELLGTPIPRPSYRVPSTHGLLNLVLDGRAWAVLPMHLVQKHLDTGRLVDLCPGHQLPIDLFCHISTYLDQLPLEITETVRRAASRLGMAERGSTPVA